LPFFSYRASYAALAVSLAFTLGCGQKPSATERPKEAASPSAANEPSPWRIELKVSPEHPSMVKPLTFTLHVSDEHARPINDADVGGTITMKLMDMGATHVKFTPKGNGDYEASTKDMDMSGAWNLTVDVVKGPVHAKKNFEFTVYD
jgi:hypothetical protein